MEPAGIHERQQRHYARRQAQTRVLPIVGQLLHAVHQGIPGGGSTDLGNLNPERTDGYAKMGVVYLHGRGGARLSEELSWSNDEAPGVG